jgi:hypothetical protein
MAKTVDSRGTPIAAGAGIWARCKGLSYAGTVEAVKGDRVKIRPERACNRWDTGRARWAKVAYTTIQ